MQIQPISGEHAKSRPAVASLINDSSSAASPTKRIQVETSHKRRLSESISDWQAEVLPLISKLLESCLPGGRFHGDSQDANSPDSQESAALLRMKENLMSRQYLSQQSFETDMHQLQASCLKKCAGEDKRRKEIEDLFATFYRDLRILQQSSLEVSVRDMSCEVRLSTK